jgi:hypothetical protein
MERPHTFSIQEDPTKKDYGYKIYPMVYKHMQCKSS